MRLADVQKMVIRHTGLVPMRVTRDFAPYRKNSVNGFPPDMALMHFKNGDAVFAANPTLKPEVEHVTDPKGETGPVSAAATDPTAIPADWETMHHLKRIFLAGKIKGVEPRGMKDEEAREIIAEEVARRAAAQ